MKIRKSKETLILTQSEKAILSKAYNILDDIFDECENNGDLELFSDDAKNSIGELLEIAEVEGGEPSGAINITIIM
jgi:hypothetical protein